MNWNAAIQLGYSTLLVILFSTSCTNRRDSDSPAQQDPAVPKDRRIFLPQNATPLLPEDLGLLRQQSGYLEWDAVSVYSRTLRHYRQVRFRRGSNVIVSETGHRPGQVDVVEAMLVPDDSHRETEFALYDPASGRKLGHYPETIEFDIQGIPGGSRGLPVPHVCTTCHLLQKPLLAILPPGSELEEAIADARKRGFGIRQQPVDPTLDTKETLKAIHQINAQMQELFPEYFNDLRVQLKSLPESAH